MEYKASSRFPIWPENFLKSFKKQCPKSQFSWVIKNKHKKKEYDPHVPQKALLPALCVSLCLCGGMMPGVSAAEIPELSNQEEITPYALYIRKAECTLSLNGGIATIRVSVTGQTGVVERCQVVVTLEEKNGTTWKTIATWSDESDGGRASVSETKAVTAGKTYRAKVVVTAWSGSKSETKTILSSEKKA